MYRYRSWIVLLVLSCVAPACQQDEAGTADGAGLDATAADDAGTTLDAGDDGALADAAPADAEIPTGVQPMAIPDFPTGEQTVYSPFLGIRVVHRTTDQPRPLSYYIVLIDPDEPGIDFRVTPPNGPNVDRETTRQTATDFLEQTGAQLAINAHFYGPFPPVDDHADLGGISVSQAEAYSPFDDPHDVGIGFQPDNTPVLIRPPDPANPGLEWSPPVTLDDAVGAREQLITTGTNTGTWTALHPRTALGIASNGEIVISVVDGRQDGRSEGMGTDEVADILISDFDVVDAINLDGGGSTTLAIADAAPRLLNIAVGTGSPMTERLVGSHLAIFAQHPPPPAVLPDLVAHEPFAHARRAWGTTADPTPNGGGLSNLGGATGWASAWVDDFGRSRFFGVATYPDDTTAGRPASLAYVDGGGRVLEVTGNQARGCYGTDCAATLPIDTHRVGADWLTPQREIGADGAEVWVSFLGQSETSDTGDRWAYLLLGDVLRLGRISDGGGTWGVQDARSDSLVMSAIPAGDAVLFVARIRFLAGDDQVDVWLNPPLDAIPASPTLSTSLPSFTFRRVSMACRYSTDFDELRVGRTYAAVTPHL